MLIQTREEFIHARTILLDAELCAVDTETDGFDGPIIGISTYCLIRGREPLGISFYFPIAHNHDSNLFSGVHNLEASWRNELKDVFDRESATWIFHNFKFDLQKFWGLNWDIKGTVYDTMLMSWMLDENTPNSLDAVGERITGEKKVEGIKAIADKLGGWAKTPPDAMAFYAEKDAELTFNVFGPLKQQMEAQSQWELLPLEMEFARCLAEIEYRGIRLDREKAQQLSVETAQQLEAMRDSLGFDPAKPRQLAHKLFARQQDGGLGLKLPAELSKNKLASPITLSDGTTIANVPKMDRAALLSLKNDVAAAALDYRSKQKALSTWFLGFQEKADAEGRLHTTFKQHGTVTTRLSSSNPNVQQIPRTNEEEREAGLSVSQVKSLFLPEENCELWEFDYSQAEYRLAGCYSQEPDIVEGYKQGIDFHSLTAQKLGIPRQAEAGSRRDAKNLNFAILYGAYPNKIAEMLETNVDEARYLFAEFWEQYPRLHATVQNAEKAAHRGWITYWDGRRRHFQYPSEYRKAFNSAIQGGVVRIMIRSMLKVRDASLTGPFKMHLQVHDSLWISIHKDAVEESVKEIQKIMEWPTDEFPIPFVVDAKRLAA